MSEYVFPTSIQEAVHILKQHDGQAQIIAGGTDVMPDIRKGKIAPRCLVDITRVPGLEAIEVSDRFVTVGAAVTFAAIQKDSFLDQRLPALVEAAASVGAAAIQSAATWVGNIIQAMPAADGAIIALALDAEVRIVDQHGAHWHKVETLFQGPGVSVIDPTQQVVSHIRFSRPETNTGTAWRRVGRRPSLVLPILNCAVKLKIKDQGVQAAIALGPVAPRPQRMRQAEAYLGGKKLTVESIAQAAQLAQAEANPRSSVMRASREYRMQIIPALVSETLRLAARRATTQT